MKQPRKSRGSALLLSLVVVIIAVGIGGAFLAQALYHSNEQRWQVEADEAMTMCDAGMERARQALGQFKGNGTSMPWSWLNICEYCAAVSVNQNTSLGPTFPPGTTLTYGTTVTDGSAIKKAALAFMASSSYKPMMTAYSSLIWSSTSTSTSYSAFGTTSATADNKDVSTLLPASPTLLTSTDPGKVPFGQFIPFNRGVLLIMAMYPTTFGTTTTLSSGLAEPTNMDVVVTAVMQDGLIRQVEAIVTKTPTPPVTVSVPALAAVVSNDQVSVNGNTTIDGRDWSEDGKTLEGNGVPGVLSMKTVNVGGSAGIGGSGNAPPGKGAATNSLSQNYSGFGAPGYPPDPDTFMSLGSGTLLAAAQAAGTYCSTPAQFTALMTAHGGALPSHAVIYCDFDPGNGSLEIGSGNTSGASILIFHNSTDTSTIDNLHGSFTGLLMADAIVHVNAGTSIIGEVVMFSPSASSAGNVFGNGNSTIKFSSAALGDLRLGSTTPSNNTPASLQSYRRYP